MKTGTRVKINHTSNEFAKHHVGKLGVVIGDGPLSMVIVMLDDGTEYYAYPHNITKIS